MNAHKNLSRLDVLKYAPDKIARMVASEFWRAAGKTRSPEIIANSLARARELMGILETADLDPSSAAYLQPFYRRCTTDELRRSASGSPEALTLFCEELARAFEEAFGPRGKSPHA